MKAVTGRWLAYAAVSVTHVVSLAANARWLSVPTQALLMPTLMLVAWATPRGRLRTWTLIALFFAFLGDALPQLASGMLAFGLMLGGFLVAHIAWIVGLWPLRHRSAMWRGPRFLMPYLFVIVTILALTVPGTGFLTPALLAYAIAIFVTASLATALGWPGWVGGALFLVSDGLIALERFSPYHLPQHDVLVMVTYILAHALLVLGVLRYREGAGTT